MTRNNELARAYRFFRDNAGYIVGERARCALSLARAERDAKEQGIAFRWEWDSDADLSWMSDAERQQEHEVEGCIAYIPCPDHGADCKHATVLASLWGIVDADSNYRRVVEAELALEVTDSHGVLVAL
jgi:hypothetical protein